MCQKAFKTATLSWIYMQHTPLVHSDKTLTFNKGTSCCLIWSAGWGKGGFLGVLPCS